MDQHRDQTPEQSQSNQQSQSDSGDGSSLSSAQAFAQAVAVDMANMPVPPPAPAATPEPEDPAGTAAIMVEGVDALCRILGGEALPAAESWSLSDRERAELGESLTAVLAKHGVPDLPYLEEVRLAMASVGIAVPRVRRYLADRRGVSHGGALSGQKALRQDGIAPQAGFSAPEPSFAARGMAL